MLSDSTASYYRKMVCERRANQCSKLPCCLVLRNCRSQSDLQHPDQSAAGNIEARLSTSKKIRAPEGSNDQLFFLEIKYFKITVCTVF